jgi:hypothetical protein
MDSDRGVRFLLFDRGTSRCHQFQQQLLAII